MSEHPTAAEAARALRDVERRRDQSLDAVRESWWVRVIMGGAVFVLIAAPDFAGPDVRTWTSWAVTLLLLGYTMMLRSRRGSAVLGRPARIRKDAFSPRYKLTARLIILGVMLIGIVVAFLPDPHLPTVPYLRTIIGAVAALALIVFGPALERSLHTLARRRPSEGRPGDASR